MVIYEKRNEYVKSKTKKELNNLTKEQLMEQILDLYDKNKAVKEFYDFYLNPVNEKRTGGKIQKIDSERV